MTYEESIARLLARVQGKDENEVSPITGLTAWQTLLPAVQRLQMESPSTSGVVISDEAYTLAKSLARTVAGRAPARGKGAADPLYAAARKLVTLLESPSDGSNTDGPIGT